MPRGRKSLRIGTYSTGGERLCWDYYDTLTLANGTSVYRMFTAGLSSSKSLWQTNLSVGGQLPANQRMSIFAIKGFYSTAAALATVDVQYLYSWLTTTTLEFLIEGKASLFTVTLQDLLGLSTLLAQTPTAAGDNIPLIQPRFHGVYPLRPAIILAESTTFEVRVTSNVANNQAIDGDYFKIALSGVLERKS